MFGNPLCAKSSPYRIRNVWPFLTCSGLPVLAGNTSSDERWLNPGSAGDIGLKILLGKIIVSVRSVITVYCVFGLVEQPQKLFGNEVSHVT